MVVVVVAHVFPISERREEVVRVLERTAQLVHEEEGCQLFALHESKDGFAILEQWRDSAALKAHGSGPVYAQMVDSLEGLLAKPMEIHMLKPRPVGDPALGALR